MYPSIILETHHMRLMIIRLCKYHLNAISIDVVPKIKVKTSNAYQINVKNICT